jgi:hypothetical protein
MALEPPSPKRGITQDRFGGLKETGSLRIDEGERAGPAPLANRRMEGPGELARQPPAAAHKFVRVTVFYEVLG